MCFGNSTWFLNMTNVWCSLSWLCLGHHSLLINRSKSVDHNSTFHWLNGVNDNSYRSWIEHLLRLLGLNICAREPGTETRMRVVPTDTTLVTTYLLHHVHKLLLVNWINWFDRDCSTHLRHREDINNANCVVIVDLANHKTHDFKGNSRCAMLHHFQKSERADVDLFTGVILGHLNSSWSGSAASCATSHSCHHSL